jgi:hypothetical protein
MLKVLMAARVCLLYSSVYELVQVQLRDTNNIQA